MQRLNLPDFYVPDSYLQAAALHGGGASGNAVWPTGNKAFYVPIIFPVPVTLTSIAFIAVNGTGNYDLGFYDGFTKLPFARTGSTAMSAAGVKKLTFVTPLRMDAGRMYYGGLALSSTSGQVQRSNYAISALIAAGFAEQASALPLPNPMVPVTISAGYVPILICGIQ